MTPSDFLLCMIDGFQGRIQGRTLLQKRAFFVLLLAGVDVNLGFGPHFYGPYSSAVDNSVEMLRSLGFLSQQEIGFGVAPSGFEMRRYDYRLTEDGALVTEFLRGTTDYQKIKGAVDLILKAGDPGYLELSIAAKAYFILHKLEMPMTRTEIIREAEKFDWSIAAPALDSAVRFLSTLKLAAQ